MTRRAPGIRKQRAIRNHRLLELALADKDLNSTAKCVLMALLFKFQNSKTGLTNPSFEAIGSAIGVGRRSVVPAIADLKAKGWITVEGTKGGAKQTNKYSFAFHRITGKDASHENREGDFPPDQNREANSTNREGDFPGTTEEPPAEGGGGSSNHRNAPPRAADAARRRWGGYGKQETFKDVARALYGRRATL